MLKKALFLLMVLLTVPNFASAYNYWTIAANSSPNIAGAVSISGADYSTSGSTVNVVTAGVTTADFTVNPAPAGYTLAYVTIDGVKYTAPNNGATYRVTKGTRLNHTLSAVYSVKKYSVTTSKTGNGYIDPTVQVASGSSKTVNITAGLGYKIGSVSAGDAVLSAGDGVNSAAYTFSNVSADKAVSVAFVPVPAVDAKISTSAQTVATGSALEIDGSSSTSSVAASYNWSVTPATGASVTPAGSKANFSASAAGTYTVRLTLTADAQTTDVATVTITVATPAVLSSTACTACHTDRSATLVAAYAGSTHAASTTGCQGCHAGLHTAPISDASCAACHASETEHGVAGLSCASCHNSHSLAATTPAGFDHAAVAPSVDKCGSCHGTQATNFATSLHGVRPGKGTFYTDGMGEANPAPLQKGFGNFVSVPYADLPCAGCHNAAATTVDGVDTWAGASCADCHNPSNPGSAVAASTCYGCHARQAYEMDAAMGFGLTDVHRTAGMACSDCHSTTDLHGDGTAKASMLDPGAITANCKNCHGEGKSRGPISDIAEHVQHAGNLDCSTCHAQSMVACYNCHFDNEGLHQGVTHQKFASAKFGGQGSKSWRFLVNRVMPDGSTKVFPGSMQSLMADVTAHDASETEDQVVGDGQGVTFVAIASYYSHSITRTGALRCASCHGTVTSTKIATGVPVDVVKWLGAEGEQVPFGPPMMAKWQGPQGVIPVPEDVSLLKFDFVDLVDPAGAWVPTAMNVNSPRVLFKRGADVIHMPDAYVKPLSASQIAALALPYREGATSVETAHGAANLPADPALAEAACSTCHVGTNTVFATSLHGLRPGKGTFYNDGLGETDPAPLQKGFGNFVNVPYADLPCAGCHNAAVTTVDGVDTWTSAKCTDCHTPTEPAGAVAVATCYGCHSRQAYEMNASAGFGLTDVHITAGMSCSDCHSSTDMHGDGTAKASMLAPGAITANCGNCHGQGKQQGPISSIAEHTIHMNDIDCSTCHAQSMVACYNCHFDNEGLHQGVTHQKFASAKFGGQGSKSWRFLVNRVMPDGSTKVFPGSMQSLVADVTALDGTETEDQVVGDGQGVTFVAIASYYSHSITKVDALRCFDCHGTAKVTALANGQPVDVVKWLGAEGEVVNFGPTMLAKWQGPQGVIPVPEDVSLLKFDFVDLTNPAAPWNATAGNVTSPRVLFKRGADVIHMPDAYVKPLTAEQMAKLADPQLDHATALVTAGTPSAGYSVNTCQGCHEATNGTFATSLHATRAGKDTFYNHNVGNAGADPLQKGFGNYVDVTYTVLPCADCHNPAAWNAGSGDTWPAATNNTPVCTDCHGNKVAGVATTSFDAPVAKATCIGCHSRQANETSLGLTDVHTSGATINGNVMNFGCATCHSLTDMHGDGIADASQLAPGAVTANCENCHTAMAGSTIPEHTQHLANIACSTCHMESVITCYGCHFDNEASDPADSTILHAKFASGKFGGPGAAAWRFLVNRVMPDGSSKIYPASMQSLVADRTAANAPGEDNQGWTHAAIAPYYSHSITKVNALKCDKCHGTQKAIDLANGVPVRVVKWAPNTTTYPTGEVPVSAMGASYTVKPSGVIPVPENPVGKLLMDFVDLVNPAAGPLNASGTSPSPRKLFKADGPDSIHMPDAYVKPLTAAQINALATPQVRP